jgi:hypothetical protein
MYYYRISKYDPIFRDGARYTKENEWTAVSDIGKLKYGNLTASEYFLMEDKYWNTIKYLLDLCKIEYLNIKGLEKYKDIPRIFSEYKYFDPSALEESIRDNLPINVEDIELVVRLCLREEIWCKLEGKNNSFVHFGYDYYVFWGTNIDHVIEFSMIPEGIYIENFKSPYLEQDNLFDAYSPTNDTIIDDIINKPISYLGKKSITNFFYYISGYELACCIEAIKDDYIRNKIQRFTQYFSKKYALNDTLTWRDILLKICNNDEETAFEMFKNEWKEFLKIKHKKNDDKCDDGALVQ